MNSIDELYKNLVKKLTADGSVVKVSRKLSVMKRNDERVLYVYDILEQNNMMPDILKCNKSAAKANQYRIKGNEYFAKRNDAFAYQYYNLSLLYAPNDSEAFVVALANRSAVLLSLHFYIECIQDIERVFSLTYPERLKLKLVNRKSQCEIELGKITNDNVLEDCDIFKPFPFDKTYECANEALEVKYDENFGRHVVAKRDISVGEVLCTETPYTSLLLFSQYLFRCSHCLRRVGNLMPCRTCCYTLYCSDKCESTAWNEYHEVECPLMATLYQMEFTKLELLSLKIVIKALRSLGYEGLKQISEKIANTTDMSQLGCIQTNSAAVYNSKYYESIHGLLSNVEKRSVTDIFQKSVTAAVFVKFLNGKEREICGALLHHCMTVPTNIHSLSATAMDDDGNALGLIEYGAAAFAFLSLLNHSCNPNIVRQRPMNAPPNVLAAVAILPIKEGEQILDNYGYHYATMEVLGRRSSLKWQYKFDCVCEACADGWPLYAHLRGLDAGAVAVDKADQEALDALDTPTVLALQAGVLPGASCRASRLCRAISRLSSRAPLRPLADAQEALKQALQVLAGVEHNMYTKHLSRREIDDI